MSTAQGNAPKVTAILQARVGSTRLPSKVLVEVLGKPLLAYEIERLKRCACLERIVLATTDQPQDDPVAELGRHLGVDVYRGSELDVLDRYYQAAKTFDVQHVMRVTGDCPLLDPAICDRVAEEYFRSGVDFCRTGDSYADGLDCEFFTATALEQAWKEGDLEIEREHVTEFISSRPERFSVRIVESPEPGGELRLTVDEPEDFALVKAVLQGLAHNPYAGFTEIRAFLRERPDIAALNAHLVRDEAYHQAKIAHSLEG